MKQWKKHSVFALSVCISRRCDTAEFCNRFRFNETTQKMVYLIRRSIWHCGWSFYNLPFHQLIVRVFICGAAFSSHFSLNRFFFRCDHWRRQIDLLRAFCMLLHDLFMDFHKKSFLLSIEENWSKNWYPPAMLNNKLFLAWIPHGEEVTYAAILHAFPFSFVRYFWKYFTFSHCVRWNRLFCGRKQQHQLTIFHLFFHKSFFFFFTIYCGFCVVTVSIESGRLTEKSRHRLFINLWAMPMRLWRKCQLFIRS